MLRAAQRAYPNFLWKTVLALFLVYLLALTRIILFKTVPIVVLLNSGFAEIQSVNLMPFYTIYKFSVSDSVSLFYSLANIGGNIAAFIPMGLLIPVLFQRCSGKSAMYTVFLTSLFFELTQYFCCIGVADVDDVILNVIGGALGVLIYKRLIKHFPEESTFLMAVISAMLMMAGMGTFAYMIYSV